MVFALMLMIVFLVWWRAASAVHIFFPVDMATPDWTDYLQFLGIGSAIGSIFAVIVFSAAAFSLPMLLDREADAITAVVTSINAVLRNKPAMAVWAALIVLAVAPGIRAAADGPGEGCRVCPGDDPAGPHAAPDRACHMACLPRHDRRCGAGHATSTSTISRLFIAVNCRLRRLLGLERAPRRVHRRSSPTATASSPLETSTSG